MSRRQKRNVGNVRSVRNVDNFDTRGSFITAMGEGNLVNVQNLVRSHGVSCCEGWYGSYALLRDAIESGHFEIAKFLLQEGAKADCETNYVSTPLHFATGRRNLELVQLLLDKNVRIDAQNGKKETALHLAAKEGYAEIVEILLNNNASLTLKTDEGSTPLLEAAEHGQEKVLRMLLEHTCANFKGENDRTPSVLIAENKYLTPLDHILSFDPSVRDRINKLVVWLVEHFAEDCSIIDDLIDYGFIMSCEYVNESLLLYARSLNQKKLIESILKNASPNVATHILQLLHSAVKNKNKEVIDLFLISVSEADAEDREDYYLPNSKINWSGSGKDALVKVMDLLLTSGADIKQAPELLHTAVQQELLEVCKVLIRNNSDVNAPNPAGETPLYLCCDWALDEENSQIKDKIIKLLLNSGADIKIKTPDGFTPFHRAALNRRKEAVRIFLDFGVDVDLRAEDGSTPLHSASKASRGEIIEILLKNKANLEARNEKGWTPLNLAASQLQVEAVKMLLKFGADIETRGLNNETALHSVFKPLNAWLGWKEDTVKILLNHGCDASAKNNQGLRVLDLAFVRAKYDDYANDHLEGPINCADPNFHPEDNLSLACLQAVKSVKKHLITLETAGLCQRNSDQFNRITDSLSDFREKCEEEVTRMKNEKLEPQFSLYDVLRNSKNPFFARNKFLLQTVKSFNLDGFPVYRRLIRNSLKKSKSRLDLIDSGRKSLAMLVKTCSKLNGEKCSVLPVELLEQIVLYLSISDLKSLCACGEALKCQLGL